MHICTPHTLNRSKQPIIQSLTIMWENNVIYRRSRSSQKPLLRREECSRWSCRLSLRWDCAQGSWEFRELSLRWGHLA